MRYHIMVNTAAAFSTFKFGDEEDTLAKAASLQAERIAFRITDTQAGVVIRAKDLKARILNRRSA